MAQKEIFKSLEIDLENGIYKVNGRDISKSGKSCRLEFENGEWSLMITEDTLYTTNDQVLKG